MGFPGDPAVRNSPTVQETQVQSLGWEGPLENEMAAHTSALVWGTPWTEEPGGLQPRGARKSQARLRNQTTTTSQECVYVNLNLPAHPLCFLASIHLLSRPEFSF